MFQAYHGLLFAVHALKEAHSSYFELSWPHTITFKLKDSSLLR